jgi:predicted nucleic acid-binding protein
VAVTVTSTPTYLIDASVLTRLSKAPVREALGQRAAGASLARTTLTDLELGYSARDADEWDAILAAVGHLTSAEVDAHHLRRALTVQRILAGRGLRGRKLPDLVVAAVAEDRGWTVLHYDADFDHIAAVTGQSSEWVVAAGSVD